MRTVNKPLASALKSFLSIMSYELLPALSLGVTVISRNPIKGQASYTHPSNFYYFQNSFTGYSSSDSHSKSPKQTN
jgi:hypothetical protein